MNTTPKALRLQVGIFGRRNAGKSSLLNAMARQEVSIVSPQPGTTTDPVEKAMEMLPLGPVLFIDTAGIDDEGALGEQRVRRTRAILDRCDVALLVAPQGAWGPYEQRLHEELTVRKIPVVVVFSKADLAAPPAEVVARLASESVPVVIAAATEGRGVTDVRDALIAAAPERVVASPPLVSDLVRPGRPRDARRSHRHGGSQGQAHSPPGSDPSRGARRRRVLHGGQGAGASGRARAIDGTPCAGGHRLASVSEGRSGHARRRSADQLFYPFLARQRRPDDLRRRGRCDRRPSTGRPRAHGRSVQPSRDRRRIGRVKIPRWLTQYVGGKLDIVHVQGHDFPADLSPYRLVVHCGACTQNRRSVLTRIARCRNQDVPITNYGMCIAYSLGIFERALRPFPAARQWLAARRTGPTHTGCRARRALTSGGRPNVVGPFTCNPSPTLATVGGRGASFERRPSVSGAKTLDRATVHRVGGVERREHDDARTCSGAMRGSNPPTRAMGVSTVPGSTTIACSPDPRNSSATRFRQAHGPPFGRAVRGKARTSHGRRDAGHGHEPTRPSRSHRFEERPSHEKDSAEIGGHHGVPIGNFGRLDLGLAAHDARIVDDNPRHSDRRHDRPRGQAHVVGVGHVRLDHDGPAPQPPHGVGRRLQRALRTPHQRHVQTTTRQFESDRSTDASARSRNDSRCQFLYRSRASARVQGQAPRRRPKPPINLNADVPSRIHLPSSRVLSLEASAQVRCHRRRRSGPLFPSSATWSLPANSYSARAADPSRSVTFSCAISTPCARSLRASAGSTKSASPLSAATAPGPCPWRLAQPWSSGTFIDGELDDPELNPPAEFPMRWPVAPVVLDHGGDARDLGFVDVTAAAARPLHRALRRRKLVLSDRVVVAMGIASLGTESDPNRIARALARASNAAWNDACHGFLRAHYPPRLGTVAACPNCGARNDVDAPYDREFEAGEFPRASELPKGWPTFEEFAECAREMFEEAAGAQGESLRLAVDDGVPACDDGGEPLLGAYLPPAGDPDAPVGCPEISIYYRTFREIAKEGTPFDWKAELRETIEHELAHHGSYRIGHDEVDDEEREEIVRERLRIVGRAATARSAVLALIADIGGFLLRSWPLWAAVTAIAIGLAVCTR